MVSNLIVLTVYISKKDEKLKINYLIELKVLAPGIRSEDE